MPYNRQIPDAPIALSMLPLVQAENLEDNCLMYLVKPNNTIGQRCKALALSVLADWLADGNMSLIKTGEINVGTSVWKNVANVGPTLEHLYYLGAGIIDAAVKFTVGNSEWIPGNNQPSISGLYSLSTGIVEATNMLVDSIGKKNPDATALEITSRIIGSLADQNAKLQLGPTTVNGDENVTGNLDVIGKVTMGKMGADSLVLAVNDSTSAASAEQTVSDMENGRAFILLNTSTSSQNFNFSGGAVVSIAAKKGVWGIKVGGYAYPLDI